METILKVVVVVLGVALLAVVVVDTRSCLESSNLGGNLGTSAGVVSTCVRNRLERVLEIFARRKPNADHATKCTGTPPRPGKKSGRRHYREPASTARFTTATEAMGMGMELSAIAAAVIGGVSLAGGIGSIFGPALGAFLLGAVLLGLTLLGVQQFVQQIITGLILLAAVGYDRLLFLRRERKRTANLAEAAS